MRSSRWLATYGLLTLLGGCGAIAASSPALPSTPDAGDAGSDGIPCPGLGVYCGDRLGLAASKLYDCNENQVVGERATCQGACLHDPDGEQDACDCPEGDGTYCGDRVGADATRLYDCRAGKLTEVAQCAAACTRGAGAHDDSCAPCPQGDGSYCGESVGGDLDKVYACSEGRIAVESNCGGARCVLAPAGRPGHCPDCPAGDGRYCGGPVGLDANSLYKCTDGVFTLREACTGSCVVAPAGTNDNCAASGDGLQCAHLQWWNARITYGPYRSDSGRWDTDLRAADKTPIQLRHDARLDKHGVYPWGWMPEFTDLVTGHKFRFLHLQPSARYTTQVGKTYPAGTIVGLSGGASAATGHPTYSTGAHLCVQTKEAFRTVFPQGRDACR